MGQVGWVGFAFHTSKHPTSLTLYKHALSVIAAAVIGGTSLGGGTGSIPGAFLGALFMASLINGMLLLDLSSAVQNVVQGLVLILAVTLDTLYRRRGVR